MPVTYRSTAHPVKCTTSCGETTMPEFADTNSFGDKLIIIYFCQKENASYEK